MGKGTKLRKKSKVEKLFMTEKKTPSIGKVSSDPLVKKQAGGSENLEKALDDMLSCTNKGPILRSEHNGKKEKDTMPPPKERKSKLKRKKRLEKMLEAKNRMSKKKQKTAETNSKSEGPKFSSEDFGNSIS